MKCDELKSYYYYEDRVITPATHTYRVYHADKVDAAIKELKERIQLDDDEMAGFLQLEEECGGGDLRKYIAELKQKLEDAKATAYAESVDAGMENRRLRRALWMARALRARDIQRWWIAATCATITERACSVWNNVERKCRAKAEQYK